MHANGQVESVLPHLTLPLSLGLSLCLDACGLDLGRQPSLVERRPAGIGPVGGAAAHEQELEHEAARKAGAEREPHSAEEESDQDDRNDEAEQRQTNV